MKATPKAITTTPAANTADRTISESPGAMTPDAKTMLMSGPMISATATVPGFTGQRVMKARASSTARNSRLDVPCAQVVRALAALTMTSMGPTPMRASRSITIPNGRRSNPAV